MRAVFKHIVVLSAADIHGKAHLFAADVAAHAQHPLAVFRLVAEQQLFPLAAALHRHQKLGLVLFLLVFHGGALCEPAVFVHGVHVFRLFFALVPVLLALFLLRGADEGIFARIGGEFHLHLFLALAFLLLALRFVPPLHGVGGALHDQLADDGIFLFPLIAVRFAAEEDLVVIQRVGNGVAQKVGIRYLHAVGIAAASRHGRLFDGAPAEQVFHQRHIAADGLHLFVARPAFVCLRVPCIGLRGEEGIGGKRPRVAGRAFRIRFFCLRARALALAARAAVRACLCAAARVGSQKRAYRSRPVGVKGVGVGDGGEFVV